MLFNQVVMMRRSIFRFTEKKVLLADILPLLTAAVMAPNHGLTQPWQFLWVGEQTKTAMAESYGHARALKKSSVETMDFVTEKNRAVARFMAIPAVLMVACRIDDDPIVAEEDYAATCCAVQNLLLAATDQGLGAQWSTHPMIRDKAVLEALGLDAQKMRVVAMVYLGYPAAVPPEPPRKAASEFLMILP
jgi:nitroreductase